VASIIPFLPPLRSGLPDLTTNGKWEPDVALALRQLSGALDLRGTRSDVLATTSIPDLWAQPLSFLSAWRDPSHLWFARARGEWRGLLAIMALPEPERADLGIQVIYIDLAELRRNPWDFSEGGRPTMAGNLMAILAEFCPKARLNSNQSWTRLGLIAMRDRVRALIVPANLICPAREYHLNLPKEIDWRDEESGRLIDPCVSGRLSSARATALAVYLDHLISSVEGMPILRPDETIDRELYGSVRDALTEYLGDVHRMLSAKRGVGRPPEFAIQPLRQELAQLPQGFLAQVVAPVANHRAEPFSDALLAARTDLAVGLKGAAVFGPGIAKMLGRHPDDFRIWGPFSESDVLRSSSLRQLAAEQAAEDGYDLLTVSDLFTETLVELNGGDATGHPASARNCLLPLDPRVLQFFNPDSLRSRLRIQREGNTVQVQLDLTLLNSDRTPRVYTARKTFSEGTIRRVKPPTVLVTWPNFSSEHWKHHYVFHSSEKDELHPRQAISARTLSSPLRFPNSSWGPSPRVFMGSDGDEIGFLRIDHRPEALLCEIREHDASEIAGLVLLDAVPNVVADEQRWQIGVDFGTTNTSIHYLQQGIRAGHPSPMNFSRRLTAPIGGNTDLRKIESQRNFVPDDDIAIPFLSILEERSGARASGHEPIIGQRVHYVRMIAETLSGFTRRDKDREMFLDLKWSRDRSNLSRVEAYLSQICMQSLAELVAMGAHPSNVEWSFSQPGSFSSLRSNEFSEVYDRVIHFALGVAASEQIPAAKLRLESEAAALYFLRRDGISLGNTAFTLDVGGQTTDICLWHDRRLLWQTSVRFAGQHILIPYLVSHRNAVCDSLRKRCNLEGIEELLGQVEQTKLTQGLEVIVNSEFFQRAFDLGAPSPDDPILQELDKLAEFSLAGLLYYLGLVARHLTTAGRLPSTLEDVRICLGGRGSLIFKSVTDAHDQFGEYFARVSELAIGNLTFHTSREPKHEVSFGMLIPRGGAGGVDFSAPYQACILGEEIEIGDRGRIKRALEVLENGDEESTWRVRSLPQFNAFLDLYRRMFRRPPLIEGKRRKDLISRVDNGIADLRESLNNDRNRRAMHIERAEPIFIVPLRELVLMMNETGTS
jgi:hypothetical protein